MSESKTTYDHLKTQKDAIVSKTASSDIVLALKAYVDGFASDGQLYDHREKCIALLKKEGLL